jgi:Protein of unknown function (DUF2815)
MKTSTTSNTKETNDDARVITGKVRFSYLHVFEPTAMEGQTDKKYSVSLIISKKDKALLAKINKAVQAAIEAGKTSKFAGKVKNLKMPLRDGDIERDGDDAYEGCFFITASSKTKPGLVDSDAKTPLTPDDLKSGDYGRASINFYAFNKNGNKGVAAGLNNLMKLEDGEALSGRPSAEDDFADFASDEDDDDLI